MVIEAYIPADGTAGDHVGDDRGGELGIGVAVIEDRGGGEGIVAFSNRDRGPLLCGAGIVDVSQGRAFGYCPTADRGQVDRQAQAAELGAAVESVLTDAGDPFRQGDMFQTRTGVEGAFFDTGHSCRNIEASQVTALRESVLTDLGYTGRQDDLVHEALQECVFTDLGHRVRYGIGGILCAAAAGRIVYQRCAIFIEENAVYGRISFIGCGNVDSADRNLTERVASDPGHGSGDGDGFDTIAEHEGLILDRRDRVAVQRIGDHYVSG